MDNKIKSLFHDIVLELTGWDEPNNGRLLRIADLKINGKLENAKYFNNWNRLNQQLDKLTFDAPDKTYVYIPSESGGFLIDTTTFNEIMLPYKSLSTLTFLGNFFFNDFLVLVYRDELTAFNIIDRSAEHYKFPAGNLIWSESDNNGDLLVTYINPETKTQVTENLANYANGYNK